MNRFQIVTPFLLKTDIDLTSFCGEEIMADVRQVPVRVEPNGFSEHKINANQATRNLISANSISSPSVVGCNSNIIMEGFEDDPILEFRKKSSITDRNTIALSPNPAKNNVRITGLEKGSATIQVIDAIGKLVVEAQSNEQQYLLDISRLKTGVYTIKLIQNNRIQSVKMIKE